MLLDILRYDVFVAVPGWRPNWLNWQGEYIFEKVSSFWRNEALAHQYVPSYKFSSWRAINKNYPIEMFRYHWESGNEGEYYILQDLSDAEKRVLVLDFLAKQA